MLKKAGIVVVAAAAGLLAVSPLAFAGESHKDWGHGHSAGANVSSYEQNSQGLVNVSDTNVSTPLNLCNNDIAAAGGLQAKDITTALTGALGIFGTGVSKADVDTDSSRACVNGVTGDSGR